jgi:hypothetical protein
MLKRGTQANVEYLVESEPFNLPDFQRGEAWDTKKKSLLILSVLEDIGFPPLVIIRAEDEKKGFLLDGLQRFTALKKFIENEYKLAFPNWANIDEEIRERYEGKRFKDLAEEEQAKILNHQVSVIEYLVPKAEKKYMFEYAVKIFNRVNSKPTPLTKGQLMYVLSYNKDLSPKLSEVVERANRGEDKKKAGFRTLARYLAVLQNYDIIKSGEGKWKPSNFYDVVVGDTLIRLRDKLESASKEERKEIIKRILEKAEAFGDYAEGLFDYVYDMALKKYEEEVYPKLVEEYSKKYDKSKAELKARERVQTLARKEANQWKISKKAWIADFFAVLEIKREDLSEKLGKEIKADEFWEEYGIPAWNKIREDKRINEIINDKKKDSPQLLAELVDRIEKSIEEVIKNKEEIKKETEQAVEEADKLLEEIDFVKEETPTGEFEEEEAKENEVKEQSEEEKREEEKIDIEDLNFEGLKEEARKKIIKRWKRKI